MPEAEEPAVLEEAVHNADHPDVFAQAGDARAQAADAPHNQLDLHPRLRGPVERLDDLGIDQRIQLRGDVPHPAVLADRLFKGDQIEYFRTQLQRRLPQLLVLLGVGIARHTVEEDRGVPPQRLVAG